MRVWSVLDRRKHLSATLGKNKSPKIDDSKIYFEEFQKLKYDFGYRVRLNPKN